MQGTAFRPFPVVRGRRDICYVHGMSWRGLVRSLLIVALAGPALVHGLERPRPAIDPAYPEVLQRFLTQDDSQAPAAYRALRRLEARNERRALTAWMDVWTQADGAGGFTYDVVSQGGSGLIRSKVFIASLEAEKKMSRRDSSDRAALTPANYVFEPVEIAGGLSALAVTPRREDVMLINGSIFLEPGTGDLVRLEGRLAKAPSFWIRQVDVVRCYERVGGVRMPVSLEAVAKVRLAGRNSFRMTYQYETVNGQRVGDPDVRLANARP